MEADEFRRRQKNSGRVKYHYKTGICQTPIRVMETLPE